LTVIPEISAQELAVKLEAGEALFLLDVREQNEADFAKIENSTLIPLGQIPQRLDEIPKDQPIIAYCHHGRRSERALQFLKSQGFNDVLNMTGGIDAWSVSVDPEVPRY
jgi:rhodanese-related sulfurtransferase